MLPSVDNGFLLFPALLYIRYEKKMQNWLSKFDVKKHKKISIFDTEILQMKIVEKVIKSVITLWLHFFCLFYKIKAKNQGIILPYFLIKNDKCKYKKFNKARIEKQWQTKVK